METICEDVHQQRARAEELASSHITGEPSAAVKVLESLASTTIRRQLDVHDLKAYLEEHDFQLRDLAKQTNLPLLIEACCDRYERSFSPYLIGGRPIGRQETAPLLAAVGDSKIQLILLHGRGGCGKSGVIYEALRELRSKGVPCLVMRLDQDEVGKTALTLANSMQLPAGPVQCLSAVSLGRRVVLFIDQLDAIRWTSQHSASSWTTISELIGSAILTKNLTVVLACRTHDANDHPGIRSMITRLERRQEGMTKFEVLQLSEDMLSSVLKRENLSSERLTPKQRETLRSPQNLYLWQKIHSEQGASSFATATDLCRVYWGWVRNQLSSAERDVLNERLLPALIDGSLQIGRENVPLDIQSRYADVIQQLLSIGTLVATGGKRLRFSHQSYFDFVAAEHVRGQLRSGAIQLTDWLLTHDSLFNRQQLRQLLEMSRDDDLHSFLQDVRSILSHAAVRFHLKQVALEVIASAHRPTDAELDLLIESRANASVSQHVPWLFHRDVAWFDLLHRRHLLAVWGVSTDASVRQEAYWLMNSFVEKRSDVILQILQSLPLQERDTAVESAMGWKSVASVCDGMFDECLRLIAAGSPMAKRVDLSKLAVESPLRAIRVFREVACRVFRSLEEGREAEKSQDRLENVVLYSAKAMECVARKRPKALWAALWVLLRNDRKLHRLQRARQTASGVYLGFQDRHARRRISEFTEHLLIIAGVRIARRWPEYLWVRSLAHANSPSRVRQRVSLLSLASVDRSYAERLFSLIFGNAGLLICGRRRRGSSNIALSTLPARRVFRRFGPTASAQSLVAAEAAVRSFIPTAEKQNWQVAHDCFMGKIEGWNGASSRCRIYPRTIFACQYALLDSLPIARMTDETRDWFGVLSRKLGPVESMLQEPPSSGLGSAKQ